MKGIVKSMRKLKSKERSDKKQMRNIEQVNNIKQIKKVELGNSKKQIEKAKQGTNTRVIVKIDRKIETKKVKSQKGITLLVLVITIIILLILSGITIGAITGENGLIQNAIIAKDNAEIDNEKEVLEKAVVQAMGNNKYGNIEEDKLQEQLDKEIGESKTNVTDVGEVIKVTFENSKRNYAIDENGNIREMTWCETSDENGNKYITNGEITLQTGDYIKYNANDIQEDNDSEIQEYTYTAENEKTGANREQGQTFSSSYETNWRLLGVEHTVNGDYLKIIPATTIQSTESTGLTLSDTTGYLYGIEEIENICKIYGHGKGALYARAMKIEDVNEITGYDPKNTGNGNVYKEGEPLEYLNEITVTRTTSKTFEFKCSNGAEIINYTYPWICYFNEKNEWTYVNVGETVTLIPTYYSYYPTTLTDSSAGDIKGIKTSSREYSMLFSDNYWLGSKYFYGGKSSTGNFNTETNFSLFTILEHAVQTHGVTYCKAIGGNTASPTYNIMPIVYLNKDIKLQKTGEQINACTEWEFL